MEPIRGPRGHRSGQHPMVRNMQAFALYFKREMHLPDCHSLCGRGYHVKRQLEGGCGYERSL
eukprot:6477085-Amphidinium_carterae.1